MADNKTPEQRSQNMAAIHSKNTTPEMYLRKLLFAYGYRYRIHAKSIAGKPDLWLKKYNTAIFVNGCFWHRHYGCKYAYMPKSRTDYWENKFRQNILRDQKVRDDLLNQHIKCLIVWECTVKKCAKHTDRSEKLLRQIEEFLLSDALYMEI